ncbi:MAG: DNA polymerase I [Fimbriimonadales bacterium]
MAAKKLVLIDGFSLLFRAFYGTRFLSTSDGRPTNALFGFVTMLYQLIEREKPECIVVAFDTPAKTFRAEQFADYKAHRTEPPDELKSQFPLSRELVDALGIPVYELAGFEADDIIGTLSLDAEKHGYETIIVTGDLDSLQLVDDHVQVMTTKQGVSEVVIYGPAEVVERYGFGPEYVPDYKALVGDPSDNIPGVPGVGAKTAEKLIKQFGSIEEIIKNIDAVEPKFKAKLEPFLDQMPKSKWLATIVRDVPVKFDYKPFRINERQASNAKEMLQMLEFRSQVKRFNDIFKPYFMEGQLSLADVEVVRDKPDVKSIKLESYSELEKKIGAKRCALYYSADNCFASDGKTCFSLNPETADQFFSEHTEQCVLHDCKKQQRKLSVYKTAGFDTMLASYVLQSGRSSYEFDDIAQGYLDEGSPQSDAERAVALLNLVEPLTDRLKKEDQWSVYADIELPLAPVLAHMESLGVLLDQQMLTDYSKQLAVTIEQTQKQIHEQAGEEFNIGSPLQLGKILFDKLKLATGKKTKTGYSTGAEVLQQLAPEHEIVSLILSWRELTKLKSTYVDALPKLVADDGRIHTTFNQTVAATGRLSSIDPNLQNIPVRTDLGREIRRAFIAPKGTELASLDYSQIELRILAHMCGDEQLMDAFQKGQDIHAATASLMWSEPIDQVGSAHRRYAKMLNFAVLYGVTDFGLANQLGGEFSVSEAKELINNYYARFPKIKAFIEGIVQEAREKGFTRTLCGRRRYFSDIHAGNRVARQYAERQAMNAPIQGSAADMIKLAMLKLWPTLQSCKTKMILQVHDELLFELDDKERDLLTDIRKQMETAMPLDVPTEVDASVGKNWLEMTEIA